MYAQMSREANLFCDVARLYDAWLFSEGFQILEIPDVIWPKWSLSSQPNPTYVILALPILVVEKSLSFTLFPSCLISFRDIVPRM